MSVYIIWCFKYDILSYRIRYTIIFDKIVYLVLDKILCVL